MPKIWDITSNALNKCNWSARKKERRNGKKFFKSNYQELSKVMKPSIYTFKSLIKPQSV